jgi:16S rRNA (adenine1518-N6/adenine1519-N6)-dimethyltransferase
MIDLPLLKNIIKKYDLAPKKSLGQNFILDQNITDNIVTSSGLLAGQDVIEIGPGPGGLTRSILKKNPNKLVVIEQDDRCIQALKELKYHYPQLEIINGDALQINIADLGLKNPKIIANLPYNIGTALLINWLYNIGTWSSLTLMFQREVAKRIVADPGGKDFGRLSIIAQLICDTEMHFELGPEAFYPPPKVTSAVISLYPKKDQPSKDILKSVELVCKVLFNQRRKMLRSTLKQLHPDIDSLILNTDISLTQRPEELSIEQFVQIAKNHRNISL